MNDIKVTVNFGTFVTVMIVWVLLLSLIAIQSVRSPVYDLPDVLMNLFMLITGSVMTVFQGFEKGVTFGSKTETIATSTTTTNEKKEDEK